MRLTAPFYARGEHLGIDLPGARALFTTRRGGFSRGPYASLNLGRLTADRPEAVQSNRAKLQDEVGVPPAHIRQVHGTVVRRITALPVPGVAPLPDEGIELPEADGQATPLREVAPMVLVADCLPIAVAGRSANGDGGSAVAMLHAGWRGLAGGILAEGVHALRELGVDRPDRGGDRPRGGWLLLRGGGGGARGVRRARPERAARAQPRPEGDRPGPARYRPAWARCTTSGCARSARTRPCSSPTAAIAAITGRQAGIAWLN